MGKQIQEIKLYPAKGVWKHYKWKLSKCIPVCVYGFGRTSFGNVVKVNKDKTILFKPLASHYPRFSPDIKYYYTLEGTLKTGLFQKIFQNIVEVVEADCVKVVNSEDLNYT